MKILMATMSLDIGGAETHILELCKTLVAAGHKVMVASNGGAYVPELSAHGIAHFSVPMHQRSIPTMLASRKMLEKIIQREKPDIVHAHARIPAFLCATLKKKLRFPLVTTAHGVYDTNPLLRLISNWGDYTLAVSDDIRAYLMQEYHLPAQQIALTVNGIDTHRFSKQAPDTALKSELSLGDGPIILHVSRLDPHTQIIAKQLICLAPALLKSHPDAKIVIIGGGSEFESVKTNAQTQNRTIGHDAILVTGPRTDVHRFLTLGTVFVGVSRAALEAMAAQLPVILAGAQGYGGLFTPDGLQAALDENFCCRTSAASQCDTLTRGILHALSLSAAQRIALGEYGRDVVSTHYSIERMQRDCIAAYHAVTTVKKTVLVSGYYGFSNAGDDAILQSIHQQILARNQAISLLVLSNNPQDTMQRFGISALPRFQFFTVLRAIKRCDALISGGGSLLQDRTSTRSLLYYLAVITLAQWMKKPTMLYANGIGPVEKPMNRRLVHKVLQRVTYITLRDQDSAAELVRLGIKRDDVTITADSVFELTRAPDEKVIPLLTQCGINPDMPFAIISVRPWRNTENFAKQLALLCTHLYTKHQLQLLFLPMQPHADIPASEQVASYLTCPHHIFSESATPQELIALVGLSHLCVAMRLHTMIFAACTAVPLLGMVYDPKVKSYLEELSMPSAGDVENFDAAYAIAQADKLLSNHTAAKETLEKKSRALSLAARKNEDILIKMLHLDDTSNSPLS